MRISDWSSDVCSSDLRGVVVAPVEGQGADVGEQSGDLDGVDRGVEQDEVVAVRAGDRDTDRDAGTVAGHRPLPAQLPTIHWALARTFTPARGLGDRPVECDEGGAAYDVAVVAGVGFGGGRVHQASAD